MEFFLKYTVPEPFDVPGTLLGGVGGTNHDPTNSLEKKLINTIIIYIKLMHDRIDDIFYEI